MSTHISVTTEYTISSDTLVELPEGKTWEDVQMVSVRWNEITLTFKDGVEKTHEISDASLDSVDWKYPDRTVVRPTDEDGNTDYSKELEIEDA